MAANNPASIGYGLQYDLFFFGFGYPQKNPGVDMRSIITGDFSWDIYGLGYVQ